MTILQAPRRSYRAWRGALLIGLVVLLFVGAGVRYALAQSIWVDESTQLSGITLGPLALLRWLAGAPVPAFGVPPDRMPPVSYLIDMACARTWCGTEDTPYRVLHLAIASGGVVALVALARRRFGFAGGVVAGVVLVFSPRLTELAVEIRAYPIFFAITCAQLWLFVRAIDAPRLGGALLAAMAALGVLAEYTHFFGLIATMALFCGIAVARVRTWGELARLAAAAAAVLLAAAALEPFVLGASSISAGQVHRPGAVATITYLLKLVGHPANLISLPAAIAFFLGIGLVGLAALGRIARGFRARGLDARFDPAVGLVVALAAGLVVTIGAQFVVAGFDPMKPTYSIWMLPPIALLAASAFSRDRFAFPRLPTGAAAALLAAGAAWGQALFLIHAGWFVHGPGDAVADAIGPAPGRAAVVYSGRWAEGFFPTYYRFHDRVPQWFAGEDGGLHRLLRGGTVDPVARDARALAGADRLVAVRIDARGYGALRRLYRFGPAVAGGDGPIWLAPDGWELEEESGAPGLMWVTLRRYGPAARE